MIPAKDADLTARARIRIAALALYSEHGFEAVTTRAIAASAGVSPALVRHHYGSKAGLRADVDQEVSRLLESALDGLDETASADDQIASLGEVTARIFGSDPHLRGYLRRVLIEDQDASGPLFSRLLHGSSSELERLAEQGALRDDTDPTWRPYQVLFLILGPLLLEPVIRRTTGPDLFDPAQVRRRSIANQGLLRHGMLRLST